VRPGGGSPGRQGGLADHDTSYYGLGMAIKDVIIPVRVTKADRDLLKRTAPGGSVSGWLRDLALAEARKRRAIANLARYLDPAKAADDMTDVETNQLVTEAIREVRRRKR